MNNQNEQGTLPVPSVGARIYTVRGQSVMLDSDLAEIFEVETKALNRAVLRNSGRFPEYFAFQLQQNEWDALRCQFGTLKVGRGQHRKYLPWVFTEHGSVMLATVLNSDRAVRASIAVVEAFVRLRHVLDANKELAHKIDDLAKTVGRHDKSIDLIFQELEELTQARQEEPPKERIGFKTNKERGISGKARKG